MEHLGRLQLSGQVSRDGAGDWLVNLGQPVLCHDRLVVVLPVLGGAEGVEVVEQAASLVLLDVESGQT